MAKMTKSQFMTTLGEMMGVSKKEANEFWDKFVELAYREVKGESGEFNCLG